MDRGAWGLQSMGSPWVRRDWATQRRYQKALYTWPCLLAARDETKLVSGISSLRIWVWDGVSQRLAVWLGLFTGELGGHRLTSLTGGLGNRGAEGWLPWKDKAAAQRQTRWPGIEWGPVTASDALVLVQPARPGSMSATGLVKRLCKKHVSCSVVSDFLWPCGLSMGFSRQEHWSGLPSPSPGNLPNPGIQPESPALQVDSLPLNYLPCYAKLLSCVRLFAILWIVAHWVPLSMGFSRQECWSG